MTLELTSVRQPSCLTHNLMAQPGSSRLGVVGVGLGGDQEEMVGRCGQLMAGWGWMSRLAGDASCQLGRLRRGCPSVASSRGGLRKSGLLAKSKVPQAQVKGLF